jgi:hypothetical protein
MAVRAGPEHALNRASFFRRPYGTAKNLLAPSGAKADAN